MLGLLSGISQFARALASPRQLAATEPGAAVAAGAAAAAAFSCTRVVAFLQLTIGFVLPTAMYLWTEGGMARQYTETQEVRWSTLVSLGRQAQLAGQGTVPLMACMGHSPPRGRCVVT